MIEPPHRLCLELWHYLGSFFSFIPSSHQMLSPINSASILAEVFVSTPLFLLFPTSSCSLTSLVDQCNSFLRGLLYCLLSLEAYLRCYLPMKASTTEVPFMEKLLYAKHIELYVLVISFQTDKNPQFQMKRQAHRQYITCPVSKSVRGRQIYKCSWNVLTDLSLYFMPSVITSTWCVHPLQYFYFGTHFKLLNWISNCLVI